MAPAVALGVGDLVRVAVGRYLEPGGDAAVVRMAVAEHDPREPAELGGTAGDRGRHVADARVEEQDAVAVTHEVHVHGLEREATPHDPDAFGDLLRLGRREPREARPDPHTAVADSVA
jgi:hypothetical protein